MVNRIQEIIRKYDLTPSRFADKLEVPRSTISHILSERNKPSLEFIQKILDHYPKISINWLLRGEGSMEGNTPDLFSELQQEEMAPYGAPASGQPLPPDNKKESTPARQEQEHENLKEESAGEKTGQSAASDALEAVKAEIHSHKKVVKLMVLYADNTFDTFYPS